MYPVPGGTSAKEYSPLTSDFVDDVLAVGQSQERPFEIFVGNSIVIYVILGASTDCLEYNGTRHNNVMTDPLHPEPWSLDHFHCPQKNAEVRRLLSAQNGAYH